MFPPDSPQYFRGPGASQRSRNFDIRACQAISQALFQAVELSILHHWESPAEYPSSQHNCTCDNFEEYALSDTYCCDLMARQRCHRNLPQHVHDLQEEQRGKQEKAWHPMAQQSDMFQAGIPQLCSLCRMQLTVRSRLHEHRSKMFNRHLGGETSSVEFTAAHRPSTISCVCVPPAISFPAKVWGVSRCPPMMSRNWSTEVLNLESISALATTRSVYGTLALPRSNAKHTWSPVQLHRTFLTQTRRNISPTEETNALRKYVIVVCFELSFVPKYKQR